MTAWLLRHGADPAELDRQEPTWEGLTAALGSRQLAVELVRREPLLLAMPRERIEANLRVGLLLGLGIVLGVPQGCGWGSIVGAAAGQLIRQAGPPSNMRPLHVPPRTTPPCAQVLREQRLAPSEVRRSLQRCPQLFLLDYASPEMQAKFRFFQEASSAGPGCIASVLHRQCICISQAGDGGSCWVLLQKS